MSDAPKPVIGLLPLDERPVNVGLVRDVAAIAGVELATPPASALPRFRVPADTGALATWLLDTAADERTRALVVSVDMLVHGGLIPARTSSDSPATVIERLDVLRGIRASRPDLRLLAVSLITRASDSYSNVEEPEYWSSVGRELHALGGATHRAWEGQVAREVDVPGEFRADFAGRRLRNHLVNLAALGLKWDGVIDHLSLTADDTADYSAGSAEQRWLAYWQLLHPVDGVAMHPGADETGAVLVARALLGLAQVRPVVSVLPGDPDGMLLTPPYENLPLRESIPRHVESAGGGVGDDGDVAVVVHTSDPARGDQFSLEQPVDDAAAARRTADVVERALERFETVAVADVRYANGADATFVRELAERGLLWRLSAYSGWNTAGNAAGSAIALALAEVAGRALGTLDRRSRRVALARRVLDDYAYQAVVRREVVPDLFDGRINPLPEDAARDAARSLTGRLAPHLSALGAPDTIHLRGVELPWRRSFEVDLDVIDADPS